MSHDSTYDKLKRSFYTSGFNIVARIKAGEYDAQVAQAKKSAALLPGAKSIILAGFAGKNFWDVLQQFLRDNREFRETHEDWIDDYTVINFEKTTVTLDDRKVSYKMAFPFGPGALTLDFSKLGLLGGVGNRSLLGVLIHPEYGPWISLRGAIITDLKFREYDKPLSWFNPCSPCSKPCVSACPASTISRKGWDWQACMNFRLNSDTCAGNCASRRACPYGKEHQYTEEQLAYHHKFVLKSVKEYFEKS